MTARILFASGSGTETVTRSVGGSLQEAALIAALKTLGHELFRVFLDDGVTYSSTESSIVVPRRLERPVRFLTNHRWVNLAKQVDSMNPDLLILRHPQFADYVPSALGAHIPVILYTANFEFSLQMMRSLRRPILDQIMLGIGESIYLRKATRVWTVSNIDHARYKRLYGLRNVATIPNVLPTAVVFNQRKMNVPEILFVGAFDYRPNEVAARFLVDRVMPVVWATRSNVRLILAGHSPPSWMRALASPKITVTGTVKDLAEYYHRATLVVVPISIGGGTKYKFLEAMSYGKAIVSTAKGAEGIRVAPQKDFSLSKMNGKAFANSVLELLEHEGLRDQLGKSAHSVFVAHYTQEKLTSLIAKELLLLGVS